MWTKRVPAYAVVAAWVIGAGGCFVLMSHSGEKDEEPVVPLPAIASPAGNVPCAYTIKRLAGFNYIMPLVSAEPECESASMHGMKEAIVQVMDTFRAEGILQKASVYVRDFRKNDWFAVNENEAYDPGSMLKVPVMMTYLKMVEADPQLFGRTMRLHSSRPLPVSAFPPSASIEVDKDYSLADLLQYTIQRSDNKANLVLVENMDMNSFHHTFTDIGLRDFENGAEFYPMTAPDYAMFLKALYNSSFLSPRTSEYAMELLMRAEFQQGLVQGIPESVPVAHKFGEAGSPTMGQLHECGIVYLKDNPYLIVVMTMGPDIHALPKVIGSISSIVYDSMSGADN